SDNLTSSELILLIFLSLTTVLYPLSLHDALPILLLAPDFMEEIFKLPFELNIEIVGSFLYFYVKGRRNVDEQEMLRLLSRAFDSDRKSTRLNSSHGSISYAVFCLKKKKDKYITEI